LAGKPPEYFIEPFAYAAGNLVGQGPWVDDGGDQSPLVVPGHGVRSATAFTPNGALVFPPAVGQPDFAGDYMITMRFEGLGVALVQLQFASINWLSADESTSASFAIRVDPVGPDYHWELRVNGDFHMGSIPFFTPGNATYRLQVNAAGDVIFSNDAGILFLGNVGAPAPALFDHAYFFMEDDNAARNLRVAEVTAVAHLL
jgi:hypothetical protein